VSCRNGRLRFEVNRIRAVFDGRLEKNGSAAIGQWTQGPRPLPLELKRVQNAPEPVRRPQEPKRPYPYEDEEVTYENKKAGITLRGTLTLPRSAGPAPAVVLLTGGGAQDRDETILGHKPYLVLADELTRRGIVVLRADDRGFEKLRGPGGLAEFLEATTEDFASDALAGVSYLQSRREIDPKRIGLIGSSDGGLSAALAAVKSPDVAFIVLLAAPGQTLENALLDQCEYILRAGAAPDKMVRLVQNHYARVFDVLRKEKGKVVAEKTIRRMEGEAFGEFGKQEREWLASVERTMMAGKPTVRQSAWLRYLLTHDPMLTLMKVECPVLALIGDKDVQVPANENLPLIREALEAGGHGKYTVKELPGLNHMFQSCKTGMPTEYGTIEETFSPVALKLVGDWILQNVGAP
jgi:fermentation-respiration switch protein FrsA (DUF1100 family)